MGFFKRSAAPAPMTEPPAPQDTRPATERLKDRFARAVFWTGTPLRSQVFVDADNDAPDVPNQKSKASWLEISYVPEEGYVVWRKARYDINGADQPLIAQERIKSDLPRTFWDAVDYLARYDSGQEKLGLLTPQTPPAPADKIPHFKAVAEAEGIAFDYFEDLPHPTTEEGDIISDGTFEASAYEKAKAAAQKRAGINPQAKSALSAVFIDTNSLPVFIAAPGDSQKPLSKLPELEEMHAILCELRDFVRKANREGWHRQIEEHKPNSLWDDGYKVTNARHLLWNSKINDAQEVYKKSLEKLLGKNKALGGDEKLKADFMRVFNVMALYAYLNYATSNRALQGQQKKTGYKYKRHYQDAFMTACKYTYGDDDYKRACEHVAYYLGWLGHPGLKGDSALVKRLTEDRRHRAYPREIDQVISWFEETKVALERAAANDFMPTPVAVKKGGGQKPAALPPGPQI